jgi:DNA mismatch endonuclease (patch repair protein)
VFVDGCFWHGCPTHGSRPQRNAGWWASKLDRTRERDAETTGQLVVKGWLVLRYWEHEEAEVVAEAVETAVRQRGSGAGRRSPGVASAP